MVITRSNDTLRPFWAADLTVARQAERLALRQREIAAQFAHTRRVNFLVTLGYPDPEFSIAFGHCWRCDVLPRGTRDTGMTCECERVTRELANRFAEAL